MSNARYMSAAALRDALDREGCAFGQVTRERVDNISAHLQKVEAMMNGIAVGVALQLVGFLLAIIMLLVNHAR